MSDANGSAYSQAPQALLEEWIANARRAARWPHVAAKAQRVKKGATPSEVVFEEDRINTEDLRDVLEGYKSSPVDWQKYAHFDPHKYTRTLVDVGNVKFNLLVLCWGPGMGSSIHDLTDSHCFEKVLEGLLLET